MEKSSKNKKNRSFSLEFKQEAIELAKKIGNVQAAKDLDVHESSIRHWRRKLDPTYQSVVPEAKSKSYADLEKENKKLQKELNYMKQINDVLKKSTAIFSADQMEKKK